VIDTSTIPFLALIGIIIVIVIILIGGEIGDTFQMILRRKIHLPFDGDMNKSQDA